MSLDRKATTSELFFAYDNAGGTVVSNGGGNPQSINPFNPGTVIEADANYFTNAAGVITILRAGWYEVSYTVNFATTDNTSGARSDVYVELEQNGALINQGFAVQYFREARTASITKTIPVNFAANDTLELITGRSGGTTNIELDIGSSIYIKKL